MLIKQLREKPCASSKSDCQGSHNQNVSPATVHRTEAVFSIVRGIYGREHDDPMDDLDVNMATCGIFLNTTLQAAVHFGQDYEANLRFVKKHFWNSVGQLFNDNGKLISEQTQISGVSTIMFKELTWMSTSLLCEKAYQITNGQSLRLLRLCALCGQKWEMILLQPGRAKLNCIGYSDGVRVENIPRNHNVWPPREDAKSK